MVDSTVSYERCMEAAGMALASGDRASAERALRAAVQSIEGFEGAHLELASVLIKLGTLKQEMGNFTDAEEFFRKALDVSERALGSYDLGLVPALTGLGTSRIMHGAPEQAEPVLARALAIAESHLGENHPDLVILINDLTRLYLKQSAYAFAEPLLLRLLAMKRSKGEDHPEVATVLASLAAVRQALGRYEAAEQLWRRVLDIRERTLAPNHFSLATSLEHLAETCAARGKVREALQLLQRAQTIRETTLGVDHPSLRGSRERVADMQLQLSEISLDSSEPASASDRPRLSLGEPLRITGTSTPTRESSAPIQPTREPSAPIQPTREPSAPIQPAREPSAQKQPVREPSAQKQGSASRVIDREPTARLAPEDRGPRPQPAPLKSAPADAAQQHAAAMPYLDVLKSIKDELEDIDERQGRGHRAMPLIASVSAFLKQRPAATIGVGASVLLLVALTVAAAARSSSASSWAEEPTVAAAEPRLDSLAVTAALSEVTPAGASTKDSIADAPAVRAAVQRPRTDDGGAASRSVSERAGGGRELASIVIPTVLQPSVARLDSVVRANSAPVFSMGEAFPVILASSLDSQRSSAPDPETAAPLRARLIGAMPAPKYPPQMIQGGVGGEVRVRFDLDTLGRPVMSSFSVVSSPHSQLTASVRKVIAAMRFEPARSPSPESRPTTERIEMGFQFTPPER